MDQFDYIEAFSRNVGWVTEQEQLTLKDKRVAIAGMGGVGGVYLITLARLGIQKFHIADFDHFELQNFNRQYGANTTTINLLKTDTMASYAKEINPDIEIKVFKEGLQEHNAGEFFNGCDLYADGIDIFSMKPRILAFRTCAELGIPAVTIAPLGMGAALGTYLPGGMTFEEYFQIEGYPVREQVLRLVAGLAPKMLHMGYLVDQTRVNLEEQRGPSTINGCLFCAGVLGTEALKILLGRKGVVSLPYTVQIDGYKQKSAKSYRPWGNRNPLQKLLISLLKSKIK